MNLLCVPISKVLNIFEFKGFPMKGDTFKVVSFQTLAFTLVGQINISKQRTYVQNYKGVLPATQE